MTLEFSCHTISPGQAEGPALCSKDPVLFYQTDFTTGVFREAGHDLEGKCIAGKILIFPGGKGSSVVQADGMYKLDVPMVDDVDPQFYHEVKDGDVIRLDATAEKIYLLR